MQASEQAVDNLQTLLALSGEEYIDVVEFVTEDKQGDLLAALEAM